MSAPQSDHSNENKSSPQNEQNLLFSERNFKLFWDSMGRGVVYHDSTGRAILMNPAAVRILGQSIDEFQNKTPSQIEKETIREDGSHITLDEHPANLVLRTGQAVNGMVMGIYNQREKAYRWINISATPLFNPGETQPYQVYTIFEDITAQKASQSALRQSEERFRKMFEEHQAVMLLIDPASGAIMDGNLAAIRFYGYPREILSRMKITDINQLKPDQTDLEMKKALNNENSLFIFPHKLASGEVRTVEVYSSPININNRPTLFSIIHDITARLHAEAALQISERRYRNLFESMNEGFANCEMIYDPEGQAIDFRYLIVNPAFATLTGLPVDKVMGHTVKEVIPGIEPFWIETYNQVVISGVGQQFDNPVAALGKYFEVNVWRSGPGSFAVVFNDVTEKKKLEEKINSLYKKEKAQRQKLQEEARVKNLFIDVLAHELRNPLTAVLSSSSILQDQAFTSQEIQKRLAANINKGAVTLAKRLDDLLDVARFSKGAFKLLKQPFDISKFIQDVVDRFRPALLKKAQTLEINMIGDLGSMVADQSRLEQVIINLLSNASKYSDEKCPILLKARIKNKKLLLEVKDRGVGISLKDQNAIFLAYHRVGQPEQTSGIGLGLYISRLIVEAHGGKIWVTSQVGQGSAFSILIPLNIYTNDQH